MNWCDVVGVCARAHAGVHVNVYYVEYVGTTLNIFDMHSFTIHHTYWNMHYVNQPPPIVFFLSSGQSPFVKVSARSKPDTHLFDVWAHLFKYFAGVSANSAPVSIWPSNRTAGKELLWQRIKKHIQYKCGAVVLLCLTLWLLHYWLMAVHRGRPSVCRCQFTYAT